MRREEERGVFCEERAGAAPSFVVVVAESVAVLVGGHSLLLYYPTPARDASLPDLAGRELPAGAATLGAQRWYDPDVPRLRSLSASAAAAGTRNLERL